MLDKRNYELEYMRSLQEKYKKDPALLERVLYAFGLLEALKILENQDVVKRTYYKVVAEEIEYRGLTIGRKEVLQDTINACLSIISRGVVQKEDYKEYIKGIKAVGTHILFLNYSGEIAAHQACKVLYLATCLLKEKIFVKY